MYTLPTVAQTCIQPSILVFQAFSARVEDGPYAPRLRDNVVLPSQRLLRGESISLTQRVSVSRNGKGSLKVIGEGQMLFKSFILLQGGPKTGPLATMYNSCM